MKKYARYTWRKRCQTIRNHNLEEAEDLIVQAKTIIPEFSECYRVQGYLLKDSSPSIKARLEKAIAFNPGSAIARYAYAQFLISEEDFSRARVQIDKALEIDAGDIALLTCKAWILTLSGDYKSAAELYEYLVLSNIREIVSLGLVPMIRHQIVTAVWRLNLLEMAITQQRLLVSVEELAYCLMLFKVVILITEL